MTRNKKQESADCLSCDALPHQKRTCSRASVFLVPKWPAAGVSWLSRRASSLRSLSFGTTKLDSRVNLRVPGFLEPLLTQSSLAPLS